MGPTGTSAGFGHEAILYDSEDQFLSVAVPFVQEGVSADEIVMVNLGPAAGDPLHAEIFDGPLVRFGDYSAYAHPVSTLAQYQRQLDTEIANGAVGFTAVGAVDFDKQQVRWREWMRYEALINHVFATYPFHGLCTCDTRLVAPEIIDGVRRAHPGLHNRGEYTPDNAEYVGAAEFMGLPEYAPPPDPLEAQEPVLDVADVTNLARSGSTWTWPPPSQTCTAGW